jgi:GTPase SAR1 family protein
MDGSLITPENVKTGAKLVKEIIRLAGQLKKYFTPESPLLVTGSSGAGKSVWVDYLTGKAYQQGYRPPLMSHSIERAKITADGENRGLLVIPGQDSVQWRSVQNTLLGKKPPLGVIHVICDGYVSFRDQGSSEAIQRLTKLSTLEKFLKESRREELENLTSVAANIRSAHQRHRKPIFMLLALTKSDLLTDSAVRLNHYSPGSRSEFAGVLDELVKQCGSDHFRWSACVASGALEPFQFVDTLIKSRLSGHERDALISNLVKLIVAMSQEQS